jgi:hypothetical protein
MAHRRAVRRFDEATVRRWGARSLRLLSFIAFGGGWLVLLDFIALFRPGKATPLAVLTFLAAIVAYRLVRELADQLERGEWP